MASITGRETLDIDDYQGKIIYLYCFQSWCPGCHKYGFPTLQKVMTAFEGDDNVVFIAVQTTFEGFATNTFERGKEIARQYDLDIPIGFSGSPEQPSELMRNYQTRGTPWTVIVGQAGIVQYNNFHIEDEVAIDMINYLKTRKAKDN